MANIMIFIIVALGFSIIAWWVIDAEMKNKDN